MIYSTATVPVNPKGEIPLSRAQVWQGLILKARDAGQFLPPDLCARCDVVEESATHVVREATIGGSICAKSSPSSLRQGNLLPGQRPAGGRHRERAFRR